MRKKESDELNEMRTREKAEDKLIMLRDKFFMFESIRDYHNEINSNPNLSDKEKKERCKIVTALVKEFYYGGISVEREAEINRELFMVLGLDDESSSKPVNSINNNSGISSGTKPLHVLQYFNNNNCYDSNNGNAINNDNDCINNGNGLNIFE
jgi:hypothetical protein